MDNTNVTPLHPKEKTQKEEQKTVNNQTQIEQELKIFKSSIDKDYIFIQKTYYQ